MSNTSSYTLPFNGVPGNFNNWEVDGATDVQQGSNADDVNVEPNIDMIAEFDISTSNYSAEFAKSAGAAIEVITKSGTSQFHGSAFEFVRNDAMDANDWFINRDSLLPTAPKTPLKRNNFGFTVGGPLYIPNHYNTNKDKTFFFVSEEWRRNRDGEVFSSYAPSAKMRTGDFSECDPKSASFNPVVASGCALPISPTTGLPVDQVTVNPIAATMMNDLVPLPNSGPIGYSSAPESTTNSREDSVRLDHNVTDKTRVFARWTPDAYNLEILPGWAGGNYPTVKTPWIETDKSGTLHLTQSLRPDLLNEVIVGYSLNTLNLSQASGVGSPGGTIDKPSGFATQAIFPQNESLPYIPGFSVSGGIPGFSQSTGYIYDIYSPLLEVKDNLVWTRGKHILKTGLFLARNDMNNNTGVGCCDPYGTFNFSSGSSVSTGNGLADMFLGRIGSYSAYGSVINGQLCGGYGLGHWRQWDFEPYFQDDWRVSSRLTLNLGVRYYDWSPWADKRLPNLDSIFIPSQYNSANQGQLDASGYIFPRLARLG